jgi:hypothetical protein
MDVVLVKTQHQKGRTIAIVVDYWKDRIYIVQEQDIGYNN